MPPSQATRRLLTSSVTGAGVPMGDLGDWYMRDLAGDAARPGGRERHLPFLIPHASPAATLPDRRSGAMTGNAIEIRGLRKVYPAQGAEPPKVALEGLDLTIPEGSIFGLLGPNGAGKSTTINIMAGLTVKTAGTVRIWGFDQDENPRQSRAAIGVVPQEINLDAFFTPRASLEVQAGLYGVPKRHRRTDEILARVGRADKADAYARQLSGGMRRRLLIAKAFVHNPPVLVLDEPTAGVVIELRRMLWEYVRELNASGTTTILTTHYLEEAEAMCDRIGIINAGKLIADEPTPDLIARMDRKALVITPARPVMQVP